MRALFDDHHEALVAWREAGLTDLTCIHVDAHLDVSADGFSQESLAGLASTRTRADFSRFRGQPKLPWGGLHCGNYLYPALVDGTVTTLIWVVPRELIDKDSFLQSARQNLQGWVDFTLEEYRSFHTQNGWIEGRYLGRRLVVCTCDHVPPLRPEAKVALDIDVDYFIRLRDDTVWQTPQELREILGDLQPVALTVATSCEGGYTPPHHRFLGQVCLDVFGEGPPHRWVNEVADFLAAESFERELETSRSQCKVGRDDSNQSAGATSCDREEPACGEKLVADLKRLVPDGVPIVSEVEGLESTAPDRDAAKELAVDPGAPSGHALLKSPLGLVAMVDKAAHAWEELLKRAPSFMHPAILLRMGRVQEAEALDPAYRTSALDRAGRLFSQRKFDEGLGCLKDVGAEDSDARYLRAFLGMGMAKLDLTLEQVEALLGCVGLTDQDKGRLTLLQAEVAARQGKGRQAIDLGRKSLKLEPARAATHHFLARELRLLGRREEALKELRKALKLNRGRVSSLPMLLDASRLYDELGQKAMARSARRELEDSDVTGFYAIHAILDVANR